MAADFLAGLVAGTGLGILIDPRLRGYIADRHWRSSVDIGALTTQLLERLRERDPRAVHESVVGEDEGAGAAP